MGRSRVSPRLALRSPSRSTGRTAAGVPTHTLGSFLQSSGRVGTQRGAWLPFSVRPPPNRTCEFPGIRLSSIVSEFLFRSLIFVASVDVQRGGPDDTFDKGPAFFGVLPP